MNVEIIKIQKKLLRRSGKVKNNFLRCGVAGWCMEVIWTGFLNILNRDRKMTGNTSLLMFPIYGMAWVIKPIGNMLKERNFIIRGIVYTCGIFGVEYVTGSILKKNDMCPWDYSESKYNINGLIRLDYAPAWFGAGLIFEKILGINTKSSREKND